MKQNQQKRKDKCPIARASHWFVRISILFAVLSIFSFSISQACQKEDDNQRNKSSNKIAKDEINLIINKVAEAYRVEGFDIKKDKIKATVLYELKNKKMLNTGGGFHESDIDLFIRISHLLAARSVFIIGNAFGYSTFCLAEIFKEAYIDVIDAEVEGEDNKLGSEITRIIAKRHYPNVKLTIGFSPQDTPKAIRPEAMAQFGGYDLVFIDGLHTNEQIVKDFEGILPFLSPRCIIAIHDVGLCKMYQGFSKIREMATKNGFNGFISRIRWTQFGTGLVARGIDNLDILRIE